MPAEGGRPDGDAYAVSADRRWSSYESMASAKDHAKEAGGGTECEPTLPSGLEVPDGDAGPARKPVVGARSPGNELAVLGEPVDPCLGDNECVCATGLPRSRH